MTKLGRVLAAMVSLATVTIGPAAMAADTIDPALAPAWQYMQRAMPGVPYSVLEGACKEAALTIYLGTWRDAQESQVALFTKHFPCVKKIDMLELVAAALRERFLSETRAGRYIADIIQDSDPGPLNRAAQDGLLLNYTISHDGEYDDALKMKGYWYPLRAGYVGIAWNTNLVSDEQAKKLNEWKGILSPEWAGRAGVIDPSAGGVAYLPWYAWPRLYGDTFIAQVGALKPRIFGSSNPAVAALASGDLAIIFNTAETALLPLLAAGAPIRWSVPSPGIGPVSGQGIPAKAPHPNAAKLYHEYAFTEEGYTAWQKFGGAPARKGAKDERAVARESWYRPPAVFFDYDPAEAINANKGVIEAFQKGMAGAR